VNFHDSEIPQYHDACLASEFFNEWFEANGNFVLPHNKCVGYKVPLFLNGEDDIENLEASDMEVILGNNDAINESLINIGIFDINLRR